MSNLIHCILTTRSGCSLTNSIATPRPPQEIPKEFVDYFGIGTLAHSLNLVFPKLPPFDQAHVIECLSAATFETLEDLTTAISNVGTDMDKLFGIYYWITQNVSYSLEERGSTLESVFTRKMAKCDGYSRFFEGMAKRVGITQFECRLYVCLSKARGWDQLNPPPEPSADHAAVIVMINGCPWLSEPTWGTGCDKADESYECEYKPSRFLQPMIWSMTDHFPTSSDLNHEELFGYPFTYNEFLKLPAYHPNECDFRNESRPFARIESQDGIVKIQFSCSQKVTKFSSELFHLQGNCWYKMPGETTALNA
jgi:hypothetical protein